MAPPVVVDADVLLRNVDYAVRQGYAPALLAQAGNHGSLMTGVALFASEGVRDETLRHLPEIAARRCVALDMVQTVWAQLVEPAVCFVALRPESVDDPRLSDVHPKDAHVAAVVCLLAPAILITDNRKYFPGFDLGRGSSTSISLDLFTLGQFEIAALGVGMLPALTGTMAIEGSKKVVAKVGSDAALVIGLVVLGLMVMYLRSEKGRRMRAAAADIAHQAGPPLLEAVAQASDAQRRVATLAIDHIGERDALAVVARTLATAKPVMTTREISEELGEHGFSFSDGRKRPTATRAWLLSEPCFHEVERGRWVLGRA